ncbi:sialic acid-binding Ig-like lectin 5 [Sparus aurata]|uniref:sialic acid-binding Ig-like lectin 5 n=1 Tax=Sparus aurata TaxID=8175 RepID=UPI0011C129F8|nr:sialic acid-binding Ig-like lectin 5 [Sparus aurata]
MAAALTVLLNGCLLQTALCGTTEVFIPKTIEVLSGSCVTIPCSFDVETRYESDVGGTCRALWKSDKQTVVFNSSNPKSSTIQGELKGDLTRKDCSTTLNNMRPEHSKEYFLRVQCNNFRHSFLNHKLHIAVTDVPPAPTLTPSTLKVEEGTSVSLKCSAPAPCLSHSPALTWSSSLGHIQESLQENQDRTKVQTSVLTFTASHLHHGKEISCTAVYNKQDGSSQSASTSLTADISFAPQILSSYDCIQTADQLNCSCETVGNPPPALQWYLDGLPVNHSDRFAISSEPLNVSGLRSIITVSQPQQMKLSTLLCNSSNSLGSTTQRDNLKAHQDFVMLLVFIPTFVVLFLVICGLLLVIRAQRTHQIVHKSQTFTSGEANEVPNAEEEAIYTNVKELR